MSDTGWFVVLRAADLEAGAIAWVQLLDEELALWRDADGGLNAWANRCPHRGVRLTIGDNLGTELRCRYHGWRFASGNGNCTRIPAHPGHTPSATLRASAYACREAYGFIWVNLHDDSGEPVLPLDEGSMTTLRSVAVHAPVTAVADALRGTAGTVFALQPMSETVTVVHAALPHVLAGEARRRALRYHDRRLRVVRDALEGAATP